jgi:hypothetical protein
MEDSPQIALLRTGDHFDLLLLRALGDGDCVPSPSLSAQLNSHVPLLPVLLLQLEGHCYSRIRGGFPLSSGPSLAGATGEAHLDSRLSPGTSPPFVQSLLPPTYRLAPPTPAPHVPSAQARQTVMNSFFQSQPVPVAPASTASAASPQPAAPHEQQLISSFFRPAPPLPPRRGSPSSSDSEWAPDHHARWLHLGRRCLVLGRFWFQDSLAEDWYRLAYLAPMCGSPLEHPATRTHSFGATRIALITSLPKWNLLCSFLLAWASASRSSRPPLGDAIHEEFAPARSLPHILDVPRFCQRIGRYITSHHGPGGVRSGTSASWSENAGFTLFPPAGGVGGWPAGPSPCAMG